jgi:arylsulfatase A-like enzyme
MSVAGSCHARVAANIDIAPTVLDAAGLDEVTQIMDGSSLLKRSTRRRLLMAQWQTTSPVPEWASTRTRRHQYVEYYGPAGGITFREFYRLRSDPWQLRNVLRDGKRKNDPSRARIRYFHNRLARDRKCAANSCP